MTAGGERVIIDRIRGARGQPHTIIKGGGHFLQEDAAAELTALINRFIAA